MGFLKLERNDIDVSIIFLEVHVILMIYCLAIFKRDQIKTNISVKVKVLENCLCREFSMSTTLLEFLHISLTFNMTEGKSLMVRRI